MVAGTEPLDSFGGGKTGVMGEEEK